MLGKDGGQTRRLLHKPMVLLCLDYWMMCCFLISAYERSGEGLEEAKQVDVRYGIVSVLGISEKTERNVIEVYRAEWCGEGSVV